MRTLAHLGGGIAHQLRNSATGCAIAVDMHAEECPLGEASETLSVAKRQLRLMEEYIQRFLQLGKPSEPGELQSIDLAALVENLLPLVEPSARHARVAARMATQRARCDDLRQRRAARSDGDQSAGQRDRSGGAERELPGAGTASRIELRAEVAPNRVDAAQISDTGSGPAEDVQQTLFEPFVTAKPDGVGPGSIGGPRDRRAAWRANRLASRGWT